MNVVDGQRGLCYDKRTYLHNSIIAGKKSCDNASQDSYEFTVMIGCAK